MRLLLLALLSTGCKPAPEPDSSEPPEDFELAVLTDFEDATSTPADAHDRIVFPNLGNADATSLPVPEQPFLSVFYEDGTPSDRWARLVPDPEDSANQVLQYWIENAAIDAHYEGHTKGRIQVGVNPQDADIAFTSLYHKRRVYLHPDIELLTTYPVDGDPWWIGMTIEELWLGADWLGHPNPARISMIVAPSVETGKLHLGAHCDSTAGFIEFWTAQNLDFELPTGEWMTIETGYKMGDETSGRFKVVVDAPSTGRVTVLDVTDITYHADAEQPVGLSHWQPLKIYSSDNTLHHIRDSGGVTQLYFDDFSFSETWPDGF